MKFKFEIMEILKLGAGILHSKVQLGEYEANMEI
jgi:hypothetical protein